MYRFHPRWFPHVPSPAYIARPMPLDDGEMLAVLRLRQALARGEYDVDARLDAVTDLLLAELRQWRGSSRKRA